MQKTNHKTPTKDEMRQVRLDAGLTMAQVADILGVSRMTVHNWENGNHPIKPQILEYLRFKIKTL